LLDDGVVVADPNNIVLHEKKFAFCFICKAANTSLKRAFGNTLNLPQVENLPGRLAPHRRLDLHLPAPKLKDILIFKEFGYLTAAAVRHPLARLASCWSDKINGKHFHQPFARKFGLTPDISFADFVYFVSGVPDEQADQHFRSMTWDLMYENSIVPEHILKIENDGWWNKLRELIQSHCNFDIGREYFENRGLFGEWESFYTPELRELAVNRYADDFRNFGYAA
jgi:hypothetical protein